MTVSEAIEIRRSIRKYKDTPVEDSLLLEVVRAGMMAPNGEGKQAWHFIVLKDRKKILELEAAIRKYMGENTGENYKPLFSAPAVILPCGDYSTRWAMADCSLAAQNMALKAVELGLGTCFVGFPGSVFRNAELCHCYDGYPIPEGYDVMFGLTIGYPDEAPAPRKRDFSKVSFL
ncbi:MAG: hypothetical protein E7328_01060 [Clostridiales bacterium]|nr:hypothetical protein [Clostridiales bacterium]